MNWTEVGILVVGIATLIVMLLVGWCLNKIANKIEGYAKAQKDTKDTLADLIQLMLEAPAPGREEASEVPQESHQFADASKMVAQSVAQNGTEKAEPSSRITDFENAVDMAVAAVKNPPAMEEAKPKATPKRKAKTKPVRRTTKTTVKAEA